MLRCSKPGKVHRWPSESLAARLPCRAATALLLSAPLYWFYEMSHAALNPSRAWADATRLFFKNPINPLSFTTFGKSVAAACELFERSTRRYGRPEWRIRRRWSAANACRCTSRPYGSGRSAGSSISSACSNIRRSARSRKLLIVAPMSGHYATLLRGTVEAFLPNHDVYVTDWSTPAWFRCHEGASISTIISTT